MCIERTTRLVSAVKIRLAIARTLKKYGQTINKRLQVKIILGVALADNKKHEVTRKTLRIAGLILGVAEGVMSLRRAVFEFSRSVSATQRRWRCIRQHAIIRKQAIRKKWKEEVDRLIKECVKDKKQIPLARKLKKMPGESREKEIDNYYNEQKAKYYAALTEWLLVNSKVHLPKP